MNSFGATGDSLLLDSQESSEQMYYLLKDLSLQTVDKLESFIQAWNVAGNVFITRDGENLHLIDYREDWTRSIHDEVLPDAMIPLPGLFCKPTGELWIMIIPELCISFFAVSEDELKRASA